MGVEGGVDVGWGGCERMVKSTLALPLDEPHEPSWISNANLLLPGCEGEGVELVDADVIWCTS